MQQEPDTEILQQLQKGDIAAFDILFQKYYKLLCTSAYFFLRDEQDAKDIVQALFVDLWEKKLYLHLHDDIKGYLFQAIKNRCLNLVDKQKTRDKNYKAFAGLQDQSTTPHDEFLPDYFGKVSHALEGMTGQRKLAIQMIYEKGKRYQDAANEMGISINSFKTHLKSGLKILRNDVKNTKND